MVARQGRPNRVSGSLYQQDITTILLVSGPPAARAGTKGEVVMSGIQESAPVEATAPAGAEETSTSRRRRRRRRLAIAGTGGAVLVAAVIVIVAVMASDSGSGRSGTYTSSMPAIYQFKGCGELSCADPQFNVGFAVAGGTSVEVNIKVTSGCIAFGSQTRSYTLADQWPTIISQGGGWWYVTWKQSTPFSNVCLGSWYAARVRVYNGGWSNWSAWASAQVTTIQEWGAQ